MSSAAHKIIEYAFYLLFFLVPLIFTSGNYELFEFNKMLLVYGLTVIIVGTWLVKMLSLRRVIFSRTPLDIPILLFLIANVISTFLSLDPHTSVFGYYSRFNGGLLSTISYILLYYALVSNFAHPRGVPQVQPHLGGVKNEEVKLSFLKIFQGAGREGYARNHLRSSEARWMIRTSPTEQSAFATKLLLVSLFSGFLVAAWGIPGHFGYDPTCWLLTRELNASCWRQDFNPTLRIFSTLGQPNWLAAYLAMLLPIAIAFTLGNHKLQALNSKRLRFLGFERLNLFRYSIFGFSALLLYLALLFTGSRAGILGFGAGFVVFLGLLGILGRLRENLKKLLLLASFFLLLTFVFGGFLFERFAPLTKNLFPGSQGVTLQVQTSTQASQVPTITALETGGTESGSIRKIVWAGAIDIFRHYPVFGSGVETFAYSYYLYRPQSHNLTTEWDFLYNKAHNEYLNYLATTGIFGFVSYMAIIVTFIFYAVRFILNSVWKNRLLVLGLLAGYVTYLVQNFFGFSVVPVALLFFLFPGLAFILIKNEGAKSSTVGDGRGVAISFSEKSGVPKRMRSLEPREAGRNPKGGPKGRWLANEWDTRLKHTVFFQIGIAVVMLISVWFLFLILQTWRADVMFAKGYSLTHAGYFEDARRELKNAINTLPHAEPFYYSELGYVAAILASQVFDPESSDRRGETLQVSEATDATQKALQISPANLNYWKTASRAFYELSSLDQSYSEEALTAAKTAVRLAPTEPRIRYNLALLYGRLGNSQKAIEVLKEAIDLKPNYRDAHYALALFFKDAGNLTDAKKELEIVLKTVPGDTDATEKLQSWTKP